MKVNIVNRKKKKLYDYHAWKENDSSELIMRVRLHDAAYVQVKSTFFLRRHWKIPSASERRLHTRHAHDQVGHPVLHGSMHVLHLHQFDALVCQGYLSGTGMPQRATDYSTQPLLPPMSGHPGEQGFLLLWRKNLPGEYHTFIHCDKWYYSANATQTHRRIIDDKQTKMMNRMIEFW